MDLNFRGLGKVHAKLKKKLMEIKLSVTNNAAGDVELFDEVQYIAPKLKSGDGTGILTAYAKCVA